MERFMRYAYACVGRGWWPILNKFIPAILMIDPGCDFEPKEKFGELRLQPIVSNGLEQELRHEISHLAQESEYESAHICEYCGKSGKRRGDRLWIKTLCDDCAAIDEEGVRDIQLVHRVLIGKVYEKNLSPKRREELRKQWNNSPTDGKARFLWRRGLSEDERIIIIGWDAEVERQMRLI